MKFTWIEYESKFGFGFDEAWEHCYRQKGKDSVKSISYNKDLNSFLIERVPPLEDFYIPMSVVTKFR